MIKQGLKQDLPQYRLGFVLQRPNQAFYQAFARELELAVNAATDFRGTPLVAFLESQVPSEIAATLKDLADRCQAIAMVAVDHPTVTAAVVALKDKGVPVFSLLS